MRIGTTSYIYPADILSNVEQLAGKVQDVELVIFESDEHGHNYPDADTVLRLREIAEKHDLSYTIHLPLDLQLAEDRALVERGLRVLECTQDLLPYGYVVHVDGNPGTEKADANRWLRNAVRSLERLAEQIGDGTKLCVENLESQEPAVLDSILDAMPVSCCCDVGHFWKQGLDPIPHLHRRLPRARVIHLHGLGKRDHQSLSLMPPSLLDPVVEVLADEFDGVLTLEVFNERDLADCIDTFRTAMERVRPNRLEELQFLKTAHIS